MIELGPNQSFFFPTVNSILNGTAGILLLIGLVLILKGKREAHEKVMKAAFGVSAVFLASYLYYHFNYESVKYTGTGGMRTFYFTILISHIILATLNLPFILRIMFLAHKKRFKEHARLARWVWPVWMYVSVTGVLVYLMLYILR
jgi:uncharacterized membrane protein YozB (DUF420 family)